MTHHRIRPAFPAFALFVVLVLTLVSPVRADDAPPVKTDARKAAQLASLKALMVEPSFLSMELSPDGKHIAAIGLKPSLLLATIAIAGKPEYRCRTTSATGCWT